MYLKLFIMLYADETVLLSETADGTQRILTCFEQYCNIWKLKVNTGKTKVVTFSKRKAKLSHNFTILVKILKFNIPIPILVLLLTTMEISVLRGKNF